MKLPLSDEARIPLRAAVAVALALAVGEFSDPRLRWYWAVLVAAVLVSGNWGDSTRRGLTRFAMTVAGAAAGWLLQEVFGHTHEGRVAILLLAIGLAVYFRGVKYGWFTFFITIYVVSLFVILEKPTWVITLLRVYQTFIGCGIAMAAGVLVPMPRATDQWEKDAADVLKTCRAAAARSFDRLLIAEPSTGALGQPEALPETGIIPQLEKLLNDFKSASFESVLNRAAHRRRNAFMDQAWQLARVVLSLEFVVRIGVPESVRREFHNDLEALRAAVASEADTKTSVMPNKHTGALDSFRARLAEARRDGRVPARDYLVLGAVAEFSDDMFAICSQAEAAGNHEP